MKASVFICFLRKNPYFFYVLRFVNCKLYTIFAADLKIEIYYTFNTLNDAFAS